MLGKIKKLLNGSFIRFGIVGVMNTLIGTGTMFLAYNLLGVGYWGSSALNYIVGSIFSYFANKYFTFRNKGKTKWEIFRFVANISVCYLLAYGLAKPLTNFVIRNLFGSALPVNLIEQLAMLCGMVFFVVFNYVGQRFFVFTEKTDDREV